MKRFLLRYWLGVAYCLYPAAALLAQQLNTRISATTITQQDLLQVWYEVENSSISEFRAPDFNDWMVESGPMLESSMQHTGTAHSSRQAYSYVLRPLRHGDLVVPSGLARLPEGWSSSKAQIVKVTKASASNPPPSGSLPNAIYPAVRAAQSPHFSDYDAMLLRPGETAADKIRNNLFVRVETSRQQVYVGEPLVVAYKLYCRVDLEARLVRRPTFSGCSVIDLPLPPEGEYEQVQEGGKLFRVYPIRKVQLYALQPGTITLQPLEIDAKVRFVQMSATRSPVQDFGSNGGNPITVSHTLRSTTATIQAKPLPGKRADAAGVFSLQMQLADSNLQRRQPGSLQVTIAGSGNWTMMPEPMLAWPASITVFAPSVQEKIDSAAVPMMGSRTYTYTFLSDSAGSFSMPAASMLVFDPATASYSTAQSEGIRFKVSDQVYAAASDADLYKRGLRWLPLTWLGSVWPYLLAGLAITGYLVVHRQRRKEWHTLQDDALAPATEAATWTFKKPVQQEKQRTTIPAAPQVIPQQQAATHNVTALDDLNIGNDPRHFYKAARAKVEGALNYGRLAGSNLPDDLQQAVKGYLTQCNQAIYGPPQAFDATEAQQVLKDLLQRLQSEG